MFNRELLLAALLPSLEELGASIIHNESVRYTPEGLAGEGRARRISADLAELADAEEGELLLSALAHYGRHWRELFFLKTIEWRAEYEYRVVAIAPTAGDYLYAVYADYGDALAAVVAGSEFPPWERPAASAACREIDVAALRVDWFFGRPRVAELPAEPPGVAGRELFEALRDRGRAPTDAAPSPVRMGDKRV